jgi:hypothetical protein
LLGAGLDSETAILPKIERVKSSKFRPNLGVANRRSCMMIDGKEEGLNEFEAQLRNFSILVHASCGEQFLATLISRDGKIYVPSYLLSIDIVLSAN